MKKFLVFLLVSVLFLSISVSAENRDDRYALYTKEDTFMPLRIKAKNIQKSSKRITFQSAEPADSATYILDESTAYEDVEQEAEKGLSAFISGEKTEITVYIPKCQYYLFSLKREAEVSVSAVPSFNKELDVSLPDNTNPFVVLEAFSILEENADRSAYGICKRASLLFLYFIVSLVKELRTKTFRSFR